MRADRGRESRGVGKRGREGGGGGKEKERDRNRDSDIVRQRDD